MTNIAGLVQRYVEQDSAIRKDLARGLINKRALAKHINKSLGINGSIDAIISAIRRYENEKIADKSFAQAGILIQNAKISTRTGIAIIALVKETNVQSSLPKVFSQIQHSRGEVLRIIQAEEAIKIIVDEKNVEKIVAMFTTKSILKTEKKLAEINMKLDPVSSKVPGILALLDTELANNEINIVETVSCVPELLWFISQKDLLKAHDTFLNLTKLLKK